jgi:sporulation protein YqfC
MLFQRSDVMMKDKDSWIRRLTNQAELYDENASAQPLLEICGNDRIVIEYHIGILEYSPDRITVRVKFGEYSVVGKGLSLCRMYNQQLLIRGRIQSVELRGDQI